MNDTELSAIIGYTFNDPSLFLTSITHSSYVNESNHDVVNNNERLEFLGDAIFDLIISEYLYERMKDVEEGHLTKLRALIVCERSLADCGNKLGINKYLRLGKGEEINGGRYRSSIIADAMEALIAAIYLDSGLTAAKTFVLDAFKDTIDAALSGRLHTDFKTEVQERLQAKGKTDIRYRLDREEGPDHKKTFYVSLWADDEKIGDGQGLSKKEAEQNAAKTALEGNKIVF